MLTVTFDQFLKFGPCWLDDAKQTALLRRIAKRKTDWSALDILALDEPSNDDRLWAVLREELIPAPILHEFACWCAEQVLALVENPDPRSVAAIAAKRAWLRGEIDDRQLGAAWASARAAARDAASDAARAAAGDAAGAAAWAAARAAASDAARAAQVKHLIEVLQEATHEP